MHFTFSFKDMYLNACGRSARLKRVTYIDETNKTLPVSDGSTCVDFETTLCHASAVQEIRIPYVTYKTPWP